MERINALAQARNEAVARALAALHEAGQAEYAYQKARNGEAIFEKPQGLARIANSERTSDAELGRAYYGGILAAMRDHRKE